MRNKHSVLSGVFLGVLASASSANTALDEMVITATYKPSSEMTTPMAVSAIDEDSLRNNGISSVSELSYAIPGLSFVNAGESNSRIVIRSIQSTGEPTAGLYYNDVAVSGVVGATNDSGGTLPGLRLIDTERVEVLRGPQGTLYGAGAMTGALKVHFTKPKQIQETTATIGLSDTESGDSNYDFSIANNTPFFNNRLLTRLVIYGEDKGGYIDNLSLEEDNINDSETKGARLSLTHHMSDSLSIDADWFYQKHEGDRPLWHLEDGDYNTINELKIENLDRLEMGSINLSYLFEEAELTAIFAHQTRDANQVSLDLSRFYRSFLDNAQLCSLAILQGLAPCAQVHLDIYNGVLNGMIPSALFPKQSSQEDSFELRYATNKADSTNFTTGIYYSERTGEVENLQLLADADSGNFITPLVVQYRRLIEEGLKQTAAFIEISHPITSDLNMTVGTRYFDYRRTASGETPLGQLFLQSPETPYQSYESNESGWISKFLLDLKINENIYSYTSVSEGYRPGGVNQVINLPTDLQAYQADELLNYELGFKTKWLDETLFANLNLYRAEWDDIQVAGSSRDDLFRFTSNAGKAIVDGLELELTAKLSEALTIASQLTWTDARLTEDQANDNLVASGLDGDPIPYTQDFSSGLQISYDFWQSNNANWSSTIGYNYVGGTQSEFRPDSSLYQKIDSYELINARVTSEFNNGLTASFFIDNLTNETAITYAARHSTTIGKTWATSVTPRTLGMSFTKTFN
ncbi:MAG: TonB-dependent receptor [Pseudomonadales bacterium]|nr:TonB-dependent receptor [Pseudomonadales bacterium]